MKSLIKFLLAFAIITIYMITSEPAMWYLVKNKGNTTNAFKEYYGRNKKEVLGYKIEKTGNCDECFIIVR